MKFFGIICVLLMMIVLSACSSESESIADVSNIKMGDITKVIELTLADANQPVFALIYVAQRQGFFADVGLKIKYQKYSSGRDALKSLLSGRTDVATVYETPVVLSAFDRQPIRILSSLHSSERNTGLVVRRVAGITSIADLKGKKIGVPFRTNAQFFLHQLLSSHEVSMNEVILVDIEPDDLVSQLRDGNVDAIAAWNPHLHLARTLLPAEQVEVYYSDLYTEMSMLVSLKSKLDKSTMGYVRLLSALKKAESFIRQHSEQSKAIVIETLLSSANTLTGTLAPRSVFSLPSINDTWNDFDVEVNLSNSLLGLLAQEARWMKDKKLNSSDLPDFNQYVDASILRSVAPGSVTLVNK